jgi:type IV pilus assembly protein PilC
MPLFSVKVIDQQTARVEEIKLEASNVVDAQRLLNDQGKMIVEIETHEQFSMKMVLEKMPFLSVIFAPRISMKEKVVLVQQLAVLLQAGITLVESLYLLEQQAQAAHTQEVLRQVRSDVVGGDSFSFALKRHPRDFDNFFVKTIKAGEISGNMDVVAQRLSGLLEKMMLLQAKIVMAMMYPSFTILVVIGVVIVIMLVVVPNFEKVFMSSGTELPLPTQILVTSSRFFVRFWWLIFGMAGGGIAWFINFYRGVGKVVIDRLILRIPLVGTLFIKLYVSRFIRTLATLLASGVPMVEAVASSVDTIDNKQIHDSLESVKTTLIAGTSTLSRLMEKTGMIPKMVYKMIAVGEETGEMDKMLNKAADILDREVDQVLETISKLIEPLMIVVVGGIVLFVMMALYLPMFDLSKAVQ